MSVYTTGEQVSAEMEARVKLVTVAGGFQTDIGSKVLMGKVKIDDDQVPCASIIEGADDVQNSPSQRLAMAHIRQQYAVVGYCACDPNRPNEAAHQMIRDLKRAIFRSADGKPDSTWGGQVKAVRYRGRNIGPRADGAALVMAIVEVEVEYAEDLAA